MTMRYSFADCVLDTERRELQRDGQVVPLRPKVFEVLTCLIEDRHRVVTKNELFERCWPSVVVGDASLNSCLKEIRKAIGDSGTEQKYLRTLHGHGYHFVLPVRQADAWHEAEPEVASEPRPAASREYKQVSVLACRITNAGAVAAACGPELMDSRMRGFFNTASSVLGRYGGTITERLGDGFTALFGAPQAFEDHGRRAATAAVELRDSLNSGEKQEFELSIGLHTGLVVVGNLDASEELYTAAGATTQVAQRIRDAAHLSILASDELRALIETDFDCRPYPSPNELPAMVEVIRLSRMHGGVPQRKSTTRSKFVGRGNELAIINKRLQLAIEGAGQAVCISGEPGIGKSRLLREMQAELEGTPVRCLQASCLAYRRTSPYFSLLQLLRHACGVAQTDERKKIRGSLTKLAGGAGIDMKGIDHLLHLLDTSEKAAGDLPQADVAQVFAHASRLILHASVECPLVIAIEDLHWLDATTEQWLVSFMSRITAVPILLVVTFRPGYRSKWLSHSNVSQLALPRLNDADSVALISSLRTPVQKSADVQRRIISNAQGNPFFLEELAFNLVDSDAGDRVVVPTTVQAVLASRIDQLCPADKALLQLAAVIGTPVPHALLKTLCAVADFDTSIARLESAELLYEAPAGNDRAYNFKHALTQDVAYQSLLTSARRELHRLVAAAYEQHFPDIAMTQPELVAHHFMEAGDAAKAMVFWRLAGEHAVQRSANPEAVAHFEKALAASETLPKTDQLKRDQLDLYIMLGPPTMSIKAFTSPAVESAYRKARELCDDVGDKNLLLVVLWGMWLHLAHRGIISDARPLANQIMQIATEVGDDALLLQAHHAVWTNEIWHGDLETCYESAMAGKRLYDPEEHKSHKYLFGGHDPGVCARGTGAIAAWFLGRPQEAIELTASGAKLADELDHPYSRIITMHDYMETEALRGNPKISGHYGRLAIEACTEQSVPNYLAVGHIFAGYGEAMTNDLDAGMTQMKFGLESYEALGAARNVPQYLMFFAEACQSPQHCEEGIAAIEKAIGITEHTGTIRWLPELKRAMGELLLLRSTREVPAADIFFREALQLAADQGCRSFELRAATSLARMLKDRGDTRNAKNILFPVYDAFTEGHDTRDLRVAAELMDALR